MAIKIKNTAYTRGVEKNNKDEGERGVDMYTDVDYAGVEVTSRSTSGVLVYVNGGLVLWKSKLQKVVTLSSCEAELMAVSEGCKEIAYVKKVMEVMGNLPVYTLLVDNQSTIQVLKNPGHNGSVKHMDVRIKYVRETMENVEVKYCKSEEQNADVMTNAHNGGRISKFRKMLGVK